jgi:hypothetical protein
VSVVSYREVSPTGLGLALRRARDPLVLLVLPVAFALCSVVLGYLGAWPVGFDFRGTLWEPARALLDGAPMYPDPTRDAMVVGNPAVYPPVVVLASLPLALLPAAAASWLWFAMLGACVVTALLVLDVRDWRCHVLALGSPVVVHGLFFGNLTIALVPLIALAWRFRDRAAGSGMLVGIAVAAKLFAWPLVVWLLATRRWRAAAWAVGVTLGLLLGAWAVVGFEGVVNYLALLRALEEVYAERSISVATAAAGLGASGPEATAAATALGSTLLALAVLVARRADGDRRALALVVGACIVCSPIVWPNYAALLLVPIAITWPRLAPAWFFGYAIWIVGIAAPRPVDRGVCCNDGGIPQQAWAWSHADPTFWYAGGTVAVVLLLVALLIAVRLASEPVGGSACSGPRAVGAETKAQAGHRRFPADDAGLT